MIPVKIIVSFGTTDNKTHVEALTKLARIIGDSEKLELLKNAEDYETVESVIRG